MSDQSPARSIETKAARPLRFPTRSGDQFFFMHIPKTAGTTMIYVLQQYFKGKHFFSVEEGDDTAEHLKPMESARMVRAHRTYAFLKYFSRRPILLTILRNPYKRMLSNYEYLSYMDDGSLKQVGQRARRRAGLDADDASIATLEEFASRAKLRNLQTQYVSGIRPRNLKEEAELGRKMLEVAKIHLETFPFIGLAERFDESLRLMTYTFNWSPAKPIQPQNITPSSAKVAVTPQVQALLEEANQLDWELFQHAQNVFQFRMEQMTGVS